MWTSPGARKDRQRRAATIYFDIGERLHLDWLSASIDSLRAKDRWQALARGSLRDAVGEAQQQLTRKLMPAAKRDAGRSTSCCADDNGPAVGVCRLALELQRGGKPDYATLSVATERLRQAVAALQGLNPGEPVGMETRVPACRCLRPSYTLCGRSEETYMEPKVAVFIDFENLALGAKDTPQGTFEIQLVLKRFLEKGRLVYKRAYSDWSNYRKYVRSFHEQGIELIDIPQSKMSGKNSADIRMVVDALDLCYAKQHIDVFALV